MATGFQERISRVLKCGICHERINHPKCLPCVHTFCKACINNLFQNRTYTTNEARCPICRRKFILDLRGASALPDNFLYNAILSECNEKEAELNNGNDTPICEKCNKPATNKCLHCASNMCDKCLHFHNSIPGFPQHKVLKLAELTSDEFETILRVECLSSYCKIHNLLPTRYCNDCDKVICAECYHKNHQNHETDNVTSIQKVKEHMESTSRKTKCLERELSLQLEMCNENISYLEKDSRKTFDGITAWFSKLRDIVNTKELKMKENLEEHLKAKQSEEQERKLEIKNTISSTQNLMNHIETIFKVGTDIFLVSEESVINIWEKSIEDDKKKLEFHHHKFASKLVVNDKFVEHAITESAKLTIEDEEQEARESADLTIESEDDGDKNSIYDSLCLVNEDVEAESVRGYKDTVSPTSPNVNMYNYEMPIYPSPSTPLSHADYQYQQHLRYTVSTPNLRHVKPQSFTYMSSEMLTKAKSGRDLTYSRPTYTMYANDSPTSITFIREYELQEFSGITGLTVTQDKIIVVCNSERVCYILDDTGSKITQPKKFEDPWDAATIYSDKDKTSYVYITDGVNGHTTGAIYVFTVSHRGKTGKSKCFIKGNIRPSGITTAGEHIFFCDQLHKCVNMHHVKKGFVRKISPGAMNTFSCPMYVSSDKNDLLIVSDRIKDTTNERSYTIILSTNGVVKNTKHITGVSQTVMSSDGIIICSNTENSRLLALFPDRTRREMEKVIELNGDYERISSPIAVVFDIRDRLWVGHAMGIHILKLQNRYMIHD